MGIIVSLLILEGGLRIAQHLFPISLLVDSDRLSVNRYPGQVWGNVKLNNFGFKDADFSIKKNHRVRVVALGDSFAWGIVPREYNYLTLLERSLQSDGLDVDVLNMGIPGIGPEEYLYMLRHEALFFHPDIVLVSFFIGNDFIDFHPPLQWFERFYIYQFAKYCHGFFRSVERSLAAFRAYRDYVPTFKKEKFFEIEKIRSVLFRKDNDVLRKRMRNVLLKIKEMDSICRKNGVALAFVLIPDQMQVDPELQQQLSERFPREIPVGKMQWEVPNRVLGQYLSGLGIPYMDLLDAFKAGGAALYKPRDTHWNIAGNALAAEKIKATVINLLPKESK